MLKQIAEDTGVKIGGKLFADSIGDKDSEAPTYIDMMKYNTDVIAEALKGNIPEGLQETDEDGMSLMYYGLLALILLVGSVVVFRNIQ